MKDAPSDVLAPPDTMTPGEFVVCLSDTFPDKQLDEQKWTELEANGQMVFETGFLELAPGLGADTNVEGIASAQSFSIAGSTRFRATVQLGSPGATPNQRERLRITSHADATFVAFGLFTLPPTPSFEMLMTIDGVSIQPTVVSTVPYDETVQKFFRIEVIGTGQVFFEVSTDGSNFTAIANSGIKKLPASATDYTVVLETEVAGSSGAQVTTEKFSNALVESTVCQPQ